MATTKCYDRHRKSDRRLDVQYWKTLLAPLPVPGANQVLQRNAGKNISSYNLAKCCEIADKGGSKRWASATCGKTLNRNAR